MFYLNKSMRLYEKFCFAYLLIYQVFIYYDLLKTIKNPFEPARKRKLKYLAYSFIIALIPFSLEINSCKDNKYLFLTTIY